MADDDDADLRRARAVDVGDGGEIGKPGETWAFMASSSQIAGGAQALESILGLVIHGAAGHARASW